MRAPLALRAEVLGDLFRGEQVLRADRRVVLLLLTACRMSGRWSVCQDDRKQMAVRARKLGTTHALRSEGPYIHGLMVHQCNITAIYIIWHITSTEAAV